MRELLILSAIWLFPLAAMAQSEGAGEPPARPTPEGLEISADFPFESRYIEVLGSTMHYVEEGEGDPILFLHGNPTSSYLWRNIIPHVSDQGRAIALDLIGMGKSDKPDIDYTFQDHIRYVEAFIRALDLKNITLVIHDWGSGIGLNYAAHNADNVVGIAMMEAMVAGAFPRDFLPAEGSFFYNLRHPEIGPRLIYDENFFVELALPGGVWRGLSEAEMEHYRAPYIERDARKPTYVWPQEVPFADGPARNAEAMESYMAWLTGSDVPVLLFYVSPGAIISPATAETLAGSLRNIETRFLGPGSHFIQEDYPHQIGQGIADWRRRNGLAGPGD